MSQPEKSSGQLWAGLILITLGVLFLLDQFQVWAFRAIFREWWPSLLILLGVVQIIARQGRRWVGPLVLIAVGAILQVDQLNLFSWWSMGTMWPVILIAIGVGILLKRLQGPDTWHDANRIEAKS